MTNPMFTRGPYRCCNGPGDDSPGCHIKAGKKWIATTHWGDSDTPSREEAVANGNLFAAVPELYEALERLVTLTESRFSFYGDDYPTDDHLAICKTAHAALAKARGES